MCWNSRLRRIRIICCYCFGKNRIGKLILVDFDIVEPSNLNRQQYFVDQLGMLKTDALKDNLRRINPYVNLSCHSEKLIKKISINFFPMQKFN